ncbi:MAG: InlB B-repeat-containing protein, partial [Clostridia bacterium]|nr:InlB B-repeat-containing protein [Clostridia bacterium]
GGKVNTCGTNGKFKANTNIVISKEISKHNTGAKLDLTVTEIGYTSIEYANTNLMANGNLWYLGASALSTNTQYYSAIQEDSEFAWYTLGNKVITYNTNGGNEIASKTVSVSNSSTGYLLTASDLPTPTKQFYTFEGWYRDINCTQKVEVGTAIYADITLYAKWSGKTYTINFVPNNGLAEYSETFIYTEDKGGLALPDHDKVEGYDFSCWYTDEDLTIPVSSYKEALAQINGTSTSISLYGEWVGGYTVKFFINNAEYTGTVSNINHGTINEFTASEIPVALTDTNTKYFMGWYYNGNEIRDWSFMDVGTTTYNINAQWGQKYHLIINASNSNATVGTSIQINKEEFYLNPDQLDAKFTALNNIAKAQDNVVGTNKYFVGWTNVNTGTLIGSLAANVFTDYKLTITANWGEKATLTITASKASSGYLGLGSEHSTITVMQGGQTILTVKSNGTTSASTYICPGSTITYKYTFDTLTATETNWRGQTSATHNARISVGSTVISSGLSTSSSNIDLVVTSSITIKAYYT